MNDHHRHKTKIEHIAEAIRRGGLVIFTAASVFVLAGTLFAGLL